MKLNEAILDVEERWQKGSAMYLGSEDAAICLESIEEYDWGWVFEFVPTGEQSKRLSCKVAYDKQTKKIAPVGTRGLPFAISQICD